MIPPPEDTTLPADGVESLAFAPDGKTLAAGLRDGTVRRWDLFGVRPRGGPEELAELKVKKRGKAGVWRLAFSPDGKALAAVAGKSVTLFDLASGKSVLAGHGEEVRGLALHPSGQTLATVCGDEVVRFWDAKMGKERDGFAGEVGELTSVAFSPDGCTCLAGGDRGRIVQWDVEG
jgi:WD40 repeat protein